MKDDLTSAQMVDEIVLIKANAEKSEKRFIDKFTIEENARREKEAQKSVKVEQNGEGIDTSNSVEITHSQKPVKVIQNVYMKDLVKKRQRIKSEQDIDNFVLSLKKELLSRLDDNKIYQMRFLSVFYLLDQFDFRNFLIPRLIFYGY